VGCRPCLLARSRRRYNSVSWLAANRQNPAPAQIRLPEWHSACSKLTPVRPCEKGNSCVRQRRMAIVGEAESRVLRVRLSRPAQSDERPRLGRPPRRP
jgi:hypothetical protein